MLKQRACLQRKNAAEHVLQVHLVLRQMETLPLQTGQWCEGGQCSNAVCLVGLVYLTTKRLKKTQLQIF